MIEEKGMKYLVLDEALDEIAEQALVVLCRHCFATADKKAKHTVKHKENCPALISFKALSKVKYD